LDERFSDLLTPTLPSTRTWRRGRRRSEALSSTRTKKVRNPLLHVCVEERVWVRRSVRR